MFKGKCFKFIEKWIVDKWDFSLKIRGVVNIFSCGIMSLSYTRYGVKSG